MTDTQTDAPAGSCGSGHGITPSADGPRSATGRRRPRSGAGIVGLVLAAAGLYVALALRCPVPQLVPDEFRYTHLAQSVADGQGMTWYGRRVGQSAALYVYFLAPAWRVFSSATEAYAATKVLGTLALCTMAVPVYVLARDVVDRRLALLPAALSLAGTWMLASAMTITEVLAYPLSTACLCTTVIALRRRRGRLALLALAFAVLATWARIQLAILIPVVLAAFAVDVVRSSGHRRETLVAHRAVLLGAGAATLLLALVALLAHGSIGDYEGLYGWRPAAGDVARKTGLQLLEMVVSGGFVPVLLAATATASPRAWRDARTGPVLTVFWLAASATALQSGWYIAGAGAGIPTGIERYMTYALPLAFVLATVVAAENRLSFRRWMIVGGGVVAALLLMPALPLIDIEPATWATGHRIGQLTGFGQATAVAGAAAVVVAVTAVMLRRSRSSRGLAVATCAVTLIVLALQSQASWHRHTLFTRSLRAQLPTDLQWVDHHTDGPVSLLDVGTRYDLYNYIEFFNRGVVRAFSIDGVPRGGPASLGSACPWQVDGAGRLLFACPGMATQPARYLIADPHAHATFRNQRRRSTQPRVGALIAIAPDRPAQLHTLLLTPCLGRLTPAYSDTDAAIRTEVVPRPCNGALDMFFWQERRGTATLRFRGGRKPHTLRLDRRTWLLPARELTTIRLPVPTGASRLALLNDWRSSDGAPELISADLDDGSRRTSML